MKKSLAFRGWFYLRQGWAVYFAFIFTAINTFTVTYYLAIERAPALSAIFPSFLSYVGIMSIIAIPVLISVGYVHFKRVPAYKSEAEIAVESNPYYYRLPPGFWREALVPLNLKISNMLVKILNNEKITKEELAEIHEIQKKIEHLIAGGKVGEYKLD